MTATAASLPVGPAGTKSSAGLVPYGNDVRLGIHQEIELLVTTACNRLGEPLIMLLSCHH